MAVDRPDRDALATEPERWCVTVEASAVVVVVDGPLRPEEALRLGHALVQAARRLGAR